MQRANASSKRKAGGEGGEALLRRERGELRTSLRASAET